VTSRALGWGGVAATALMMAFYVSVLAASGGWAHLADQAQSDWWLTIGGLDEPVIASWTLPAGG
jgi:hypothetical protein